MSVRSPFTEEIIESTAWLTLDRPEKHNAMGADFFSRLRASFERFDADPQIRAVVIRANGANFTSGLDLMDAANLLGDPSAVGREDLRRRILDLQASNNAIERCRKPVIAAVHGHCIGGGVDLLCACDVRIATRDAVFSIRETRLAMIADLGTLQRMPCIVGGGWFRELALTGRDFDANEALRMGFVTRLCDDRKALQAAAADLAAEISTCPPLAVQGAKEVILYSRDHGVRAGLEYVAQKNAVALHCEDLMEAAAAFFEKRPPQFKGR